MRGDTKNGSSRKLATGRGATTTEQMSYAAKVKYVFAFSTSSEIIPPKILRADHHHVVPLRHRNRLMCPLTPTHVSSIGSNRERRVRNREWRIIARVEKC